LRFVEVGDDKSGAAHGMYTSPMPPDYQSAKLKADSTTTSDHWEVKRTYYRSLR